MAKTRASRYDDVDAGPKSDAYTGLLALSLIAMIASCVVLYMDYAQYGSTKKPPTNIPPVAKPAEKAASWRQAAPADLAVAAEPLPLPAGLDVAPIVPVKAEVPADSDEGPTLIPPG